MRWPRTGRSLTAATARQPATARCTRCRPRSPRWKATNGSVGDLLVALVTGYEVVTRVARAYRPPLPLSRHPHASLSPIGAAAAVGAARRLPADAFARTVLGAASMSMTGPFVN